MIKHIVISSILGITFLLVSCIPKEKLPSTKYPDYAPIPIPNYSTTGVPQLKSNPIPNYAPSEVPQSKPMLPPTPSMSSPNGSADASSTFHFGDPVDSKAHALIAAESALRSSFDYTEPLTVVLVVQANFGEASSRIGGPVNGSPDLPVWLVIFFSDKFQSHAPTPRVAASPPFQGCAFSIVNADDGLPIVSGGPLNPGISVECDNGQH
jgi:hypothetical protein